MNSSLGKHGLTAPVAHGVPRCSGRTGGIGIILLALLLGAFCGCNLEQAPEIEKEITEKIQAVAGGGGYGNSHSSVSNVYYLVAQDGTYAEVDLATYARTQKGDRFTCRYWKGTARPAPQVDTKSNP